MVFLWSLSYSKSSQVFRTLLSIRADFNYDVVWMVSTCFPISKSSCLFTNPLGIIPSAPTTTGITVTFVPVIVGVLLLMKKATDKYIDEIPDSPSLYKNLPCEELFLFLGEYNQ